MNEVIFPLFSSSERPVRFPEAAASLSEKTTEKPERLTFPNRPLSRPAAVKGPLMTLTVSPKMEVPPIFSKSAVIFRAIDTISSCGVSAARSFITSSRDRLVLTTSTPDTFTRPLAASLRDVTVSITKLFWAMAGPLRNRTMVRSASKRHGYIVDTFLTEDSNADTCRQPQATHTCLRKLIFSSHGDAGRARFSWPFPNVPQHNWAQPSDSRSATPTFHDIAAATYCAPFPNAA